MDLSDERSADLMVTVLDSGNIGIVIPDSEDSPKGILIELTPVDALGMISEIRACLTELKARHSPASKPLRIPITH